MRERVTGRNTVASTNRTTRTIRKGISLVQTHNIGGWCYCCISVVPSLAPVHGFSQTHPHPRPRHGRRKTVRGGYVVVKGKTNSPFLFTSRLQFIKGKFSNLRADQASRTTLTNDPYKRWCSQALPFDAFFSKLYYLVSQQVQSSSLYSGLS